MLSLLTYALAAPLNVPGTPIVLDPPPGFVLSNSFPGLQDGTIDIAVQTLSIPRKKLEAGLTDLQLRARGFQVLQRETVEQGDLIEAVSLRNPGQTRWTWVGGGEEASYLVVADGPTEDPHWADVQQCLSTAGVRGSGSEVFTFIADPEWHVIGRTGDLTVWAPIDAGPLPLPPSAPRYLVGASSSPADVSHLTSFALARLRTLGFDQTDIEAQELIELDGKPTHFLTARARRGRQRRWVHQAIVAEPDGHYVVAVGLARQRAVLPLFRQMSETLRTP